MDFFQFDNLQNDSLYMRLEIFADEVITFFTRDINF